MVLSVASLRPADDEDVPAFGPAAVPEREARAIEHERRATEAVFLALKVWSQKTVVALAALVDLALIASAFAIWVMVIQNPTTLQLIGVAGYALFILTAIFLRKVRR